MSKTTLSLALLSVWAIAGTVNTDLTIKTIWILEPIKEGFKLEIV